jgi:hypothetical protein
MRLSAVGALERQVADVGVRLERLQEQVRADPIPESTKLQSEGSAPVPDESAELRTLANASDAIAKLDDNAKAYNIAATLADMDVWSVGPDDEQSFLALKLTLAQRLRTKVRDEVQSLQQAALESGNGVEGAKAHAEAGQVLAMYPMTDDTVVLDEAKRLSVQQAEVAVRLEVIRRQRYNRWAAERIEQAIN